MNGAIIDHKVSSPSSSISLPHRNSSLRKSKRPYAEEIIQAYRSPVVNAEGISFPKFDETENLNDKNSSYIQIPQIDYPLEVARQLGSKLLSSVSRILETAGSETNKRRKTDQYSGNIISGKGAIKSENFTSVVRSGRGSSTWRQQARSRYHYILHKSSPLIHSNLPRGKEFISEFDMPNNTGSKMEKGKKGSNNFIMENPSLSRDKSDNPDLENSIENRLQNLGDVKNPVYINMYDSETPVKNSKSFGGLYSGFGASHRQYEGPGLVIDIDNNSERESFQNMSSKNGDRRELAEAEKQGKQQVEREKEPINSPQQKTNYHLVDNNLFPSSSGFGSQPAPIVPKVTYGTAFVLKNKNNVGMRQAEFSARLHKIFNGQSKTELEFGEPVISLPNSLSSTVWRSPSSRRTAVFPTSDNDDDILQKLQKKRKEIYEEERRRAAASNKGTVEIELPDEPMKSLRSKYYKKISEGRKSLHEQIERLKLGDEVDEGLSSLDDIELKQVKAIWSKGRHMEGESLGTAFKIDITVRDIKTLCDGQWLNDNIIDFYLNLVAERSSKIGKKYSSFSFSTHFYSTLEGPKGYQGVARWALRKKVNVTEQDFIIIPINRNQVHWCLAVINNRQKRFEFYDSLSGDGTYQLLNLQKYMIYESDRLYPGKHDEHRDIYEKYQMITNVKCPQQNNGSDCGVFTCKMAELLSQGKRLTFSQSDMKNIRRRMAFDIVKRLS